MWLLIMGDVTHRVALTTGPTSLFTPPIVSSHYQLHTYWLATPT